MRDALHYDALSGKDVRCRLCPKDCLIKDGKKGFCRARVNRDGRLYSRIYGECSSIAMDPIEKKPLYHFFPATYILSLGTVGCNFGCCFCQNYHISHHDAPTKSLTPQEAVDAAERDGAIGIAYTYNEPIIWYEYVLDTARLAREKGLKNVLVTNGFINEAPLRELLAYIDALNIDVKAFRDSFYRHYCKGMKDPVLRTAEVAKGMGCHVEVTNLIIPTLNDDEGEIRDLVEWVSLSLGERTPLHFSRYFPHYKLDLPPTPLSTLLRAREIARSRLKHVYIGNVVDVEVNSTFCVECGKVVIERSGYAIRQFLEDGRCKYCKAPLDIVTS
jgi:pyruvate formate lyase activating enzyme